MSFVAFRRRTRLEERLWVEKGCVHPVVSMRRKSTCVRGRPTSGQQQTPPDLAGDCWKSGRVAIDRTRGVVCVPFQQAPPIRDGKSSPDDRRKSSVQWEYGDPGQAERGSWPRERRAVRRCCDSERLFHGGLTNLLGWCPYRWIDFEELQPAPAASGTAGSKDEIRSDEGGSHALQTMSARNKWPKWCRLHRRYGLEPSRRLPRRLPRQRWM